MPLRTIYKITDLITGDVKISSKRRIPWYAACGGYKVELAYLFNGKTVDPYGWIEIKSESLLM